MNLSRNDGLSLRINYLKSKIKCYEDTGSMVDMVNLSYEMVQEIMELTEANNKMESYLEEGLYEMEQRNE